MAPRLLAQAQAAGVLAGRLVSGDALYCQKALCRQIRQAGADYLFAVKANQPTLLEHIGLLFADPPPGECFLAARTLDARRGRREERHLRASSTLATYLQEDGWPDVGLVLEVVATVSWPRHPLRPAHQEVRYFLSSLPATTSPARALRYMRDHWHIENRLHWPRDVTLGEDACQVRSGHAPQVLAALRNAVVGLCHQHGITNLAAALRTHAWSGPAPVLRLLGLAPRNL